MAYASESRANGATFLDRVADLRATTAAYLARRRVYSKTLRELQDLNERDLADLGIHRAQIRNIARAAAFGRD